MERSQPISQALTRLRRSIGGTLDEREAGARQANTDLHSLRRWFIWSELRITVTVARVPVSLRSAGFPGLRR